MLETVEKKHGVIGHEPIREQSCGAMAGAMTDRIQTALQQKPGALTPGEAEPRYTVRSGCIRDTTLGLQMDCLVSMCFYSSTAQAVDLNTHFADGETEVLRCYMICPRSCRLQMGEPRLSQVCLSSG
jgi:hypothetical protein